MATSGIPPTRPYYKLQYSPNNANFKSLPAALREAYQRAGI